MKQHRRIEEVRATPIPRELVEPKGFAERAGVADGTIYLYFKSKDELLLSLFEDRVEKLLSYMRSELPKLAGAPAKLRRVIELPTFVNLRPMPAR